MIGNIASRSIVKGVVRSPQQSQMVLAKRNFTDIPFGKRQVEQIKNWVPSAATFGGAGAIALVYFTDWRVITDYIPFYNGKYKKD